LFSLISVFSLAGLVSLAVVLLFGKDQQSFDIGKFAESYLPAYSLGIGRRDPQSPQARTLAALQSLLRLSTVAAIRSSCFVLFLFIVHFKQGTIA
jgi:hypothetical protein